ncbi:S8 family peptidase [Cytobacillus sp. Hm23]
MKKWQQQALSLGLASTLLMPSLASASTTVDSGQAMTAKQPVDVFSHLNGTEKEQRMLAYEQQQAQEQMSDDTLVIKYKNKLSDKVHSRAGTRVTRSIPSLGYDVVKLKKGQLLEDTMNFYASQQGVVSVSPSYKYETLSNDVDPKVSNMYHLSLLQMDKALSLAGEHDVTVAVVDAGIDVNHPELINQILAPYNAVDPANQGVTDIHGTHVSGIIAAEKNNGIGGYGINPRATLMPIDVFGGEFFGSDYIIAEGILYAVENGADVINMSLGGYMSSPIMEEAIEKAIDAGIVVVAAAGNSATDEYHYPSAIDGVISVGATNSANELADFSNYGPSVDIVAPGEGIYNSIYDAAKNGSSFAALDGTSMASPIVAGVASLILSKHPDLKPYEVEAILERTAIDLGTEGYDATFAHGLVNPVAALQYDISHLPSLSEWDNAKVLAEGEALAVTEEGVTINGALTSPEEIDWFKLDVQAGQSVQTTLTIQEDYDYELQLRFYSANSTEATDMIEVNDVLAGGTEGELFTASENGTLAIGITDVNGNYSLQGKSAYEVTVQRYNELHEDGVTQDQPITIASLPFNSSEEEVAPFTFLPELDADGDMTADQDYFAFSVTEPQIINVELSALAGIDSSISVYFADDFNREIPAGVPEEEYGYYEPWPFETANEGRTGDGEILTFEAMPNIAYIIEASSEARFNYFYFDPFFFEQTSEDVPASALPYNITVETLELPADEDQYPIMYDIEFFGIEATTSEEMNEMKKNEIEKDLIIVYEDEWREFAEEDVDYLLASALPFSMNDITEGYFQSSFDQDFYSFTAEKDAVYQFAVNQTKSMMPRTIIYEYDEEDHDLFRIGSSMYSTNGMPETKTTIALEGGKQYFISVQNRMYRPAKDAYELSAKVLVEVPFDANEKNDETIQATVLQQNEPVRGHFILPNDIDTYYYKHRSPDEILGFTLQANPLSMEEKKNLPMELQNPLMVYAEIVEDTNGNMFIDEEEIRKSRSYWPYFFADTNLTGSFKARENVGYFILTMNDSWFGLSVKSYDVSLNNLNSQDEDAHSVVTNNIPSKPLALTKHEQAYEATGYFNTGVDFGDKDFYEFNVANDANFDMSLKIPKGIDGVMTIYNSNGATVAEFDHYGDGDEELSTVSLQQGIYYVEVKDVHSRYSNEPYTLRIVEAKN